MMGLYKSIIHTQTKRGDPMARPEKCRKICSHPRACSFAPTDAPIRSTVELHYDEYEVIRLLDLENYSQLACAQKMGVSRPTITRIYGSAKKKIAAALVNGDALCIRGGDVLVCAAPKPECAGIAHCCHKSTDSDD